MFQTSFRENPTREEDHLARVLTKLIGIEVGDAAGRIVNVLSQEVFSDAAFYSGTKSKAFKRSVLRDGRFRALWDLSLKLSDMDETHADLYAA